jgi:hypothetical protein
LGSLRPLLIALCATACQWGSSEPAPLGHAPAATTPAAPEVAPAAPDPNLSPEQACAQALGAPGASFAPDQPIFGAARTVGATTVGPDPSLVHLGWPAQDTSTSVSLEWVTDPGTLASQVEWGEGDALDQHTSGTSFTVGADAPYRVHELRLCGVLKPGTTYRYRVGGEGHWSPTYTFTTPGAPGSFDTFTMAIAGDSRGTYEDWRQVVAKMAAHDPDLYLFSGDMVNRGENAAEWLAWWGATGDTFARKVIVPAHGNHEMLSAHYFAQFSLPNNEQWFAIDYGSATIVSLNDTVTRGDDLTVAEPAYLRQVFGASKAAWRVAMHHRAAYSACEAHGSTMPVREAFAPVFDELGVDLVFAGHNHLYERSKPLRADQVVEPGKGTVYYVTGGAGAPLYPETRQEPFTASLAVVEHYLIAEFGPTSVTITARDLADNVIDKVTLPRVR